MDSEAAESEAVDLEAAGAPWQIAPSLCHRIPRLKEDYMCIPHCMYSRNRNIRVVLSRGRMFRM
jgi:hypothetical protein